MKYPYKTDKELTDDLKRIYDYVTNVFVKQDRVLKFDELWGDGTIWKPLNKFGAKRFYNTILESWQEWKRDHCTWCKQGIIDSCGEKIQCGHCNLEIEEFLEYDDELGILL